VTFDGMNSAVANVNDVLGDAQLKEDIKRSIAELPEVLERSRTAIDSLQNTVKLADKNLKNVENFTKPLGDRGPAIVANIEQSTLKLDRLLTDFSGLTKRINSSEGSLSLFLNDPQLYQNLNQAAENVACLTRELGPILSDARAFSDKIARHPEVLGVRGAIERRSGIK
jgi:phospholipid/cholesterol/gamma-HCH transport system substrate-binding protein